MTPAFARTPDAVARIERIPIESGKSAQGCLVVFQTRIGVGVAGNPAAIEERVGAEQEAWAGEANHVGGMARRGDDVQAHPGMLNWLAGGEYLVGRAGGQAEVSRVDPLAAGFGQVDGIPSPAIKKRAVRAGA